MENNETLKVKTETIVRFIVLIIALVNQVLACMGKSPLPFSSEEVEGLVSAVITVAASMWAWWKNNSFTKAAIRADEYMKTLKEEDAGGV